MSDEEARIVEARILLEALMHSLERLMSEPEMTLHLQRLGLLRELASQALNALCSR